MRKVLAFATILSVSLFLVGCGETKKDKKDDKKPAAGAPDTTKDKDKTK